MKYRNIIPLAISLFWGSIVSAQSADSTVWSLKECIDYATAHNLTIKKAENTIKLNQINKESTKWSRLPDLNAGASSTASWSKNQEDNYRKIRSTASTFSLTSTVPLFTGLEQPNRLKQAKLHLLASIEDLSKAKNDLSITITSQYIQALFSQDLIAVATNQLELSQEQLDRGIALYELEKIAKADLFELKARLKQDEVSLVEAKNNFQIALLELTQTLELKSPSNFNIKAIEGELYFDKLTAPQKIYDEALNYMPEVMAESYRDEAAMRAIKIAKAGFMPKLSLNMGLGTAYNTINTFDYDNFGNQLKNNFNQYIGLSLSIPIFNRFSTKNSVKTAKIEQINQLINNALVKKNLYNEIEKAWYNATAAETKYAASLEAKNANQESFILTKEKYQLGKATNLEFNESKVNLIRAEYDLVKAKYDYLFRIKLLNFYKGEPIE